ncbi:MAG: flagellar basal body L-ring protein FlgH [Sedimentisphaerales bacterium]
MQNTEEKSNIKKQKAKIRKKTELNYSTSAILIFTFCFLIYSSCEAGSIWAKKNNPNTYADDIARNVGDILTIRITEDSKVDNKAKRDLQKDTDRSNTFNGEIGKFADIGEFGLSAKSSNNLKSKADLKDERSFEDKITVTVVDVQPNGNLVVTGTRKRNISGDTQTIEVSGIVRTSDIAFDNTIKSEQVADFRIVSKNAGVAAPYTKPGWLGTIFDIIWPF